MTRKPRLRLSASPAHSDWEPIHKILGAAGRDFHNFNLCFRNHPGHHVLAFTATPIPDIAGRKYPPELAGPLYPDGLLIVPEEQLEEALERKRKLG